MRHFDPLWLAALPGLVAVTLWALTDLQRFVSFAVTAALILPITLVQPGGTQVALADLLMLFAFAAWFVAGSVGRRASKPWISGNPLFFPLVLFVAFNGISLAWSVNTRSTLIFTIQLTEIVVAFPLLFASVPRSMVAVRQGFYVFIFCTSILAAFTVKSYGLKGGSGSLTGSGGVAGLNELNKNVIGSFVAAGLIMAFTLFLSEAKPKVRHALGLATALELAGLVASASRGALIGTFFAALTASLLLRRGRRATITGACLLALGYLTIFGASQNVEQGSGSYDSSVVRSYSFANAVHKIEAKPLLGTGGGTYTDYIQQLQIGLPDPNNMFLLTWAELGIVGLLTLLFLLASYVRILLAVRKLPDAHAPPAVAAGCVALSLFVHFQFDITWTRGTSTLAFAMIGVMLAAIRLARAEHDEHEEAERAQPASVVERDPRRHVVAA